MPKIFPTIGRKIWFFNDLAHYEANCKDGKLVGDQSLVPTSMQPHDATICYVWNADEINVSCRDQNGGSYARQQIPIYLGEGELPAGSFCCWMPYQQKQAEKAEGAAEPHWQKPDAGTVKRSG